MLQNQAIPLTPSEVELLRECPDSGSVLFGNLTRTLERGKYFSNSIIEHVLRAAFHANVEAGVFEYQVLSARSIFGIRLRPRLAISKNGVQHTWPDPSLEARLVQLMDELPQDAGPVPIATLVTTWLGVSAIAYIQNALTWIYDGLVERGWVRREPEQRLDLFRLTRYVIPEETYQLAQDCTNLPGSFEAYSGFAPSKVNERILRREFIRALRGLKFSARI
jgi:hypothetical protein